MVKLPLIKILALYLLCWPTSSMAGDTPEQRVQRFTDKILNEKFEDRFGLNKSGEFGFLSKRLIKLIKIAECDAEKAAKEESRPLLWPDAAMFFDRWDTPTACTVNTATPAADGQTIAVDCIWGKNRDHRPSEKMQIFIKLVKQGTHWNIDNVIHGQQEEGTSTKTDLIQRLRDAGKQSSNPAVCKMAQNHA